MRLIFIAIIVFCLVYFLGGWIATQFGWVTMDDYFAYAGIFGGLASVAGLATIFRPGITASDVQNIEASALRSIAETSTHLEELRTRQKVTQQELGGLELKKMEMEFLVKKASLAIFLKEQHAYHERVILEELDKNPRLRSSLEEVTQVEGKIQVLNEEIERNPNVAELRQIIAIASRRAPTIEEAMMSLPPYVRSFYQILSAFEKVARSALLK